MDSVSALELKSKPKQNNVIKGWVGEGVGSGGGY